MATTTGARLDIQLASVDGKTREANAKALQPILTDLIAYSLNVKQLHWNVVGPNFRPVHLHLDEIYAFAVEMVDLVAERLSATGHSPTGTSASVAADSELADVPTGFLPDREVLELASHRTKALVGLIRDRMSTIEDKDTVTADLLHQVCAGLEKHHWMLRASLP